MAKQYWFWATLVHVTVPKRHRLSTRGAVWETTVIIQATNAEAAFTAANKLGSLIANCDADSLTLDDKPAKQYFIGFRNMGIIYDPLESGAEIFWTGYNATIRQAKKNVTPNYRLKRKLKQYFSEYVGAQNWRQHKQTSNAKNAKVRRKKR